MRAALPGLPSPPRALPDRRALLCLCLPSSLPPLPSGASSPHLPSPSPVAAVLTLFPTSPSLGQCPGLLNPFSPAPFQTFLLSGCALVGFAPSPLQSGFIVLSPRFVCVQIQVMEMTLPMSSSRKAQKTCSLSSWLQRPPLPPWKEVGGLLGPGVVAADRTATGAKRDELTWLF